MKKLSQLNERRGMQITPQYINDNKDVMTSDERKVEITDIRLDVVPNVIVGEVTMKNNRKYEFEWDDTGKCIKSTDMLGNPKAPGDEDNLVCAK